MSLSAIVITKNEEKDISNCLESLAFCDEIVVVDDCSSDKTREIASKHNCRVFERNLDNDFSAQRNFALSKVKGDWVLFIDADERVGPSLKNEILQAVNNPNNRTKAYFIKRVDFMWGKEIGFGETGTASFIRLAKSEFGRWERAVHEKWVGKGAVGSLTARIKHHSHQSAAEFIGSINFVSGIHAQENAKEGKKASLCKIIAWPMGKFINNFVFRKGFLDGMTGFVIALMMSFHSFLSWSKQWLKQAK